MAFPPPVPPARAALWLAVGLCVALLTGACRTARYLPDDATLVRKNAVELSDTAAAVENWAAIRVQLEQQIVTQPNGRFLFVAPREWFYLRLAAKTDTSGFDNFVRRIIAEPPAYLDTTSVHQSEQRLRTYMLNRGYFDARVTSAIDTLRPHFARVDYTLRPGLPYTFDSITYQTDNPAIARLLDDTRGERLLQPGQLTDSRVYDREVQRIVSLLRDNGYANFYANSISPLEADSSGHGVRTTLRILPPAPGERHRVYMVGNVTVFPDNDPLSTVTTVAYDTTYDGVRFIYQSEELLVDPDALAANIFMRPGERFSQSALTKTNLELNDLGVYRFVSVEQEPSTSDSSAIDFLIQLAPAKRWTVGSDVELTITDRAAAQQGARLNLVGGQVSGSLGNRNVFRGGERLRLAADAGLEFNLATLPTDVTQRLNTIEFGGLAQLQLPVFRDYFGLYRGLRSVGFGRDTAGARRSLLADGFYTALRERGTTRLDLAARYTSLQGFYRTTTVSGTYGYDVRPNPRDRYAIDQLGLEYFTVRTDPAFESILARTPFLQRSFGDQVFSGFLLRSVQFAHTEGPEEGRVGWTFLADVEQSGAEVYGLNLLTNALSSAEGAYSLGSGIDYARYVRGSFSGAVRLPLSARTAVSGRLLTASAVTFGFSGLERDVPYVRQFFSGGNASMRGWQARSLGPGGYRDAFAIAKGDSLADYQQADFKLEANLEYRTFLTKVSTTTLDGAVFLDVGNIWTLRRDRSRPGSQFRVNALRDEDGEVVNEPFYRQLAINTGAGLRLDVGYVLLRLDVGVKLRNPYPVGSGDTDGGGQPTTGTYWPLYWSDALTEGIATESKQRRTSFQIGLGYPF